MRSIGFLVATGLALVSVGCSGGVNTGAQQQGGVTITEVLPAQGPLAGNIPVQIKGTSFASGNLLVTFGGTAMTDAAIVNDTTIQGTLPATSTAGAVDVVVACANGQATLPHGFTYHDNQGGQVQITGINPPNGPVAGGTQVTITGLGFQGGQTSVTFGGTAGTGVTVTADTTLTVLTPPAAAAGAVGVSVSNNNGTASLPNAFVYGSGGGGGGGNPTVTEHLGGVSEFDQVKQTNNAPNSSGYALYFPAMDVVYPANNSCTLDLDQFPGLTSGLDAGAVTITQGSNSLALTKDNINQYTNNAGPAASFTMGQMAGINGAGSAGLGAFNVAAVASAPQADYDAWLDPLGFWNFTGGGVWNGKSDLWVSWGEGGSAGTVNNPTNHIQLYVIAAGLDGVTHVLACDGREGSDVGGFCIGGGSGSDLCQTPGPKMYDLFTAAGGPQNPFGVAATVVLYRGNRSTYQLPNGSNAAMDVAVVKATSLLMGN